MNIKYLVLVLPSTMLACASAATHSPDESLATVTSCLPATRQIKPTLTTSPCPIIVCGDNAPTAGDGLLFDELDLAGRLNYAGVHLVGATFQNHPANVNITGDRLEVFDQMGGVHRGRELIGTVIHLMHEPTNDHPARVGFQLRIACYQDRVVKFLAGNPDYVPVYDFQARLDRDVQLDDWFEVCNHDPLLPDPLWTSMPHYALVYRGDRYVPKAKALMPNDPNDGWSFIACTGSAGSKMHLYRHTAAGALDADGAPVPEFTTAPDQRTTLLKAITADYCGTGYPTFTVPHQPLAFTVKSPSPVFMFPFPYSTVTGTEAIWGPDGAHCLDTPRLTSVWRRVTVEAACGRTFPTCPSGSLPSDWAMEGHAVTANPSL